MIFYYSTEAVQRCQTPICKERLTFWLGLLCVRFVTARIFILQEHHFIQKCWKTWKCYNKCCYWNSYLEKSCVALMFSKNYWMKCHLVLLFLFCYFSFALQTVYLELMKGCVLYRRWTYFLGLSNNMQNDFTLEQNYQQQKNLSDFHKNDDCSCSYKVGVWNVK